MMVTQEQQPQPPITIDFLGLGNVSTVDESQDVALNCEARCSLSSISMKFAGVNPSVEGALQSQGFTWPQMPIHHVTTNGPQQTRYLQYGKARCGSQLTIFYDGNVNVYNDVSTNTVDAIVRMAASGKPIVGGPQGSPEHAAFGGNLYMNAQCGQTHIEADQVSQNCSPPNNKSFDYLTPASALSHLPMVPKALPLARKASLARFLEKRRERMQMMAPYMKQQQQQQQLAHAQYPCTTIGSNNRVTFARIYEEFSKKQPITSSPGM